MRKAVLIGRYATETPYLQVRGLKPTANMIESLRQRVGGIAAHPTFNRAPMWRFSKKLIEFPADSRKVLVLFFARQGWI